jgi:hypothetical protein
VVSMTDPYGRILGFLDRSLYLMHYNNVYPQSDSEILGDDIFLTNTQARGGNKKIKKQNLTRKVCNTKFPFVE